MSETLADNPPEPRIARLTVVQHVALLVPYAANG
jgi:hypothetical protein